MKPDIYFQFNTDSIHILPIFTLDWGSGWCYLRLHIGWLFWYVEIEWPIE